MRTGVRTATVPASRVPTIVFHGDADRTVHPRNGEQMIAPARSGCTAASQVEQALCRHGRRRTRSSHPADAGRVATEHWLLRGAGHAWSGGQAAGSYTDAKGPDAKREMLRFSSRIREAPSTEARARGAGCPTAFRHRGRCRRARSRAQHRIP